MGCCNSYEKMPEKKWATEYYLEDHHYTRLTVSGPSFQSAIDNLRVLCLKKGIETPQKDENGKIYCGTIEQISWNCKLYLVYNPVFLLKRAQTYFAYTYYIPV